ncbi:hypothetical protein [Maribellus sediminis]|uniref:hypothetical protein n=1 Tax=Maribellus sediminis TaxID=2696285 RepID=UPI0014309263|nr:hypothetical protein [Maribellus sediminis]
MQRNRGNKLDKLGIGLLAGMLLPLFIFVIVYLVNDSSLTFSDYIKSLWIIHVLLKVGSLCIFANLAIFWGFLHLKYEKAARGVLAATLLYAFVVLISRAI